MSCYSNQFIRLNQENAYTYFCQVIDMLKITNDIILHDILNRRIDYSNTPLSTYMNEYCNVRQVEIDLNNYADGRFLYNLIINYIIFLDITGDNLLRDHGFPWYDLEDLVQEFNNTNLNDNTDHYFYEDPDSTLDVENIENSYYSDNSYDFDEEALHNLDT